MPISILDPGFATTVQDLGRYGCAHLGISPSGAADPLSFRIANILVGNHENAPALEMTLLGATLQFDEPAIVAIAGAECGVELEGNAVSANRMVRLTSGSILKCGRMSNGARAYLAVQGGLDVPKILGSASTCLGARFGGFEGRSLRKRDTLNVQGTKSMRARALRAEEVPFAGIASQTTLRVTRGAQQEWFATETLRTFISVPFKVTQQCGRTGLRLSGEPIPPRNTSQLLTDGIPMGAIQVPPDGQPIILFVDQQTTGGYPKIANVIASDIHLLGQLRPHDMVQFEEVSVEEAVKLLRDQEHWLKAIFEGQ